MKKLFVILFFGIGISMISCKDDEPTYYSITTSVSPYGAGVISPSSAEAAEGDIISFKATPSGDYIFTEWSGSISGTDNPMAVTVTANMNLTANFILRSYPLTLSTEGEGEIIEKVISSRGDYTSGTVVELTAQPYEHWQFSHWEGDLTGNDNPQNITIQDAKCIKAVFVPNDPGIVFTETEYKSPLEVQKWLGLGWNVSCQLDAYNEFNIAEETAWGNKPLTQLVFDKMKSYGFKSVRIPVTWMGHIGEAPDFIISKERMDRVAEVVNYAEKAGMNAIVNIHHDKWLDAVVAANDSIKRREINAKYAAVWRQIARRFRDKGDFLIFEAHNEAGMGDSDNKADVLKVYECINEWNQIFVDQIRATGGHNSKRWLNVVGNCADIQYYQHDLFKIPKDYVSNNRFIIVGHYYHPGEYTHGGPYGEWGHTANPYESIDWGQEDYVVKLFSMLHDKFISKGIPVCIDEIGCQIKSTQRCIDFSLYYFEYVFKAASSYGMAPFIWDDGGTGEPGYFQYFNHTTGDFNAYTESVLDVIYRAVYDDAPNYTLQYVYDNAPYYDPESQSNVYIPDENFRKYILDNYDENNDGEIDVYESLKVTEIDILTTDIESVEGIERFPFLTNLRCEGRRNIGSDDHGPGLLKSIDLSANKKLKYLILNNNYITSLDISNNTELEELCVRSNDIENLDLTNNPNLHTLDISFSNLSTLHLANNKELRYIHLRGNKLTHIDTSELLELNTFDIGENLISDLDLSKNPNLEILECDNNNLKLLDVSYNPRLKRLICNENENLKTIKKHENQQIFELIKDDFTIVEDGKGAYITDPIFRKYIIDNFDIDKNGYISEEEALFVTEINVYTDNISTLNGVEYFKNLEILRCEGRYDEEYTIDAFCGKLKDLDISQNVKLKVLACGYNKLSELDISSNLELEELNLQNNKNMTFIDISNNKKLQVLICRNCSISQLDVTNNHLLREVDCQGSNLITNIDLTKCPDITLFNGNELLLEKLDVSNNEKIEWLGFANARFNDVDLSNNSNLSCVYAEGSYIEILDLTKCDNIKVIYAKNCKKLRYIYLQEGCHPDVITKEDNTIIVYK